MEIQSKNIKELLCEIATMYIERRDELARLDGLIGDGDHGISMARGAKAGLETMSNMGDDERQNEYFKAYGRTLVRTMGGAIGPLFGIIFTEFGKCVKDETVFNKISFVKGITNATAKIMDFGGAKPGQKTMIDVMYPLSTELNKLDLTKYSFKEITEISHTNALVYLEETKPMMARKGRSKFLMEKSMGHQDAGATSVTYLIEVINNYIGRI